MTISVPKAGEDFTVPPGMKVESIEIRAIVKGVPQAARMVHPEELTIEFDDVPDDVQFTPFFVNAQEGELVVVEVETPVEPPAAVVETPVVLSVEPPAPPAPEDLVIEPAPPVEVTPSADVTPSIPPTIDIATE